MGEEERGGAGSVGGRGGKRWGENERGGGRERREGEEERGEKGRESVRMDQFERTRGTETEGEEDKAMGRERARERAIHLLYCGEIEA